MPKQKKTGKVTRYTYDEFVEPRTPETGHSGMLPSDEEWVVVDMDPAQDPELHWSGKRRKRSIPLLPLQRNEIVSESRIARIVERARASKKQTALFAELEHGRREGDKEGRLHFYVHDEEWRNKLICGDSLQVMQSLLHYERLRGKVQMVFFDPPYGIKYDGNFQQRVGRPSKAKPDGGDDLVTICAFRDTWLHGIHSYLSHVQERLYLCRELLHDTGSIFFQISEENLHRVRALLDEVFGADNFCRLIPFRKKTMPLGGRLMEQMYDFLLWYAKDKEQVRFTQLYSRTDVQGDWHWKWALLDGAIVELTSEQIHDHRRLPKGARVFRLVSMYPPSFSAKSVYDFPFAGTSYRPPRGQCWLSSDPADLRRLADAGRLQVEGEHIRYRLFLDDDPLSKITACWTDTIGPRDKRYVVQTSAAVIRRCLEMTTAAGDLVFDPTCGGGTTAWTAEQLGRRWVTTDTSRVAVNSARLRLLGAVFDDYELKTPGRVSDGLKYALVQRTSLKTIKNGLEPQEIEVRNEPIVRRRNIRVASPFEVMTLGRYSVADWRGYAVEDSGTLANYIAVIARLYRPGASVDEANGRLHAMAETEEGAIGISVGPISGRVTAAQVAEAAEDARAAGLPEVHVLGWAFEPNVGEIKAKAESDGELKLVLQMIRPDTLAEGLQGLRADQLFSPLGLPEISLVRANDSVSVILRGLATFDRASRTTEWRDAGTGWISAWYLDEDYDGDCFVDSQCFFEFAKPPDLTSAVGGKVPKSEFKLTFQSEPFEVGRHHRVGVRVVDVFGNESTVVCELD